ncbi:MAG TPA: lactate utilization protein [Anaerolineales bacterium]|nr:lactate utilization protein [Anaerolineales bacterium]
MSRREDILKRLRSRKRVPRELADRTRSYQDLVERFRQELESHNGEVWLAADAAEAWEKAIDFMQETGVQVIAAHRTELPQFDTPPEVRYPDFDWHFAGEAEYREACAQADIGLTGADAALAETGTLVLTSGSDRARITSLLPPTHIVFLPKTKLISDLFAWKAQRPAEFPANLMFISGPSKTGDIEQALVVGVHGPRRLIVIVY